MTRIDDAVARLGWDAQRIIEDIERIRTLVLAGGDEYAGELTPAQSTAIAEALGPVGQRSASLLMNDANRTARREAGLRPPH